MFRADWDGAQREASSQSVLPKIFFQPSNLAQRGPPGSRTQGDGGGGGGGPESTDARWWRPDNTRKCATQHFRRRLALERGREGRGGRAGLGLSSRCLPTQLRSSADRRPRRLSSQLGFRGVRTPAPRFPKGLAEAPCRSASPVSRSVPRSMRRRERELTSGRHVVMHLGEKFAICKAAPPPHFSSQPCNEGGVRLVAWSARGFSVSDIERGFW